MQTRSVISAFCLAGAVASAASAAPTFTKLVATGDLVPGSSGATYTGLGRASASGGNFAWTGTAAGASGVFKSVGGVHEVVAQTGMSVPMGGAQTFVDSHFSFTLAKIDGDDVAFRAGGWIFASFGGGPLEAIATTGTINPASGMTYDSLQQPTISNGEIAFTNGTLGANASSTLYSGGSLSSLLSTSTALPSPMSGNATLVSQSIYRNGTLAMQVFDPAFRQGIVTNRNGSFEMIASGYDNIPGQSFAFGQFLDPTIDVIDSGHLAFIAWGTGDGTGYRGLFEDDGTGLTTVVDSNTAAPDGGMFTDFARGPSLFGDTLLFTAGVDGESSLSGVYARYNDEIITIADTGTLLDGKLVTSFDLHQESLFDINKGVFLANFVDGSQGIYTFELAIPAPSSVGVCLLAAIPACRRRRA